MQIHQESFFKAIAPERDVGALVSSEHSTVVVSRGIWQKKSAPSSNMLQRGISRRRFHFAMKDLALRRLLLVRNVLDRKVRGWASSSGPAYVPDHHRFEMSNNSRASSKCVVVELRSTLLCFLELAQSLQTFARNCCVGREFACQRSRCVYFQETVQRTLRRPTNGA